jgi:hypothetical protein
MAEFNSRQAALIAAGSKALSTSAGKKRTVVITSPATAAWAQNDTIASGVRIPKGARFTCGSFVSNEAMGASVTLDVGLRNFDTKVAVDADGIGAAVAVSSAGRSAVNNGALVAAGVESVTTVDTEVYATLTAANPTDNAQFRIEVEYITYD